MNAPYTVCMTAKIAAFPVNARCSYLPIYTYLRRYVSIKKVAHQMTNIFDVQYSGVQSGILLNPVSPNMFMGANRTVGMASIRTVL